MKCTAYNKRFGISAGVFSQKHLYEFASLSPVRTAVKPPPTPSRRTLAASRKKKTVHKQKGLIRNGQLYKNIFYRKKRIEIFSEYQTDKYTNCN